MCSTHAEAVKLSQIGKVLNLGVIMDITLSNSRFRSSAVTMSFVVNLQIGRGEFLRKGRAGLRDGEGPCDVESTR